jgi:nascent polypeptide-associated complex subunit alpha
MEDMNSQGHLGAPQPLAGSGGGSTTALDASRVGKGSDNPDDVPELEAPEDEDGPIDETGVDPKEIELVMAQVNCSRAKAVRVLKENGGDLINASMSIFHSSVIPPLTSCSLH